MSTGTNHAHDWRAAIHELAAFARPSASDGERRGAELIAARLSALGCRVEVEEERAHGGYWWPIGLVNAAAAVGGVLALRNRRSAVTRAVRPVGRPRPRAALVPPVAATPPADVERGRGGR
jgi:hypothetical protein